MKVKRKIIRIDEDKCDGCGLCVPSCAEGAIQIVDGKAKLIAEKYCDGLGACLGECPRGALRIVDCEAEEFDKVSVDKHLKSQEAARIPETPARGHHRGENHVVVGTIAQSIIAENHPLGLKVG